ncbi:hypothetical protein HH1059_18830 [Halorhodospira halochloris]|uniref:IraD/Gp25-like domain-containing protein n=1 Tax=Halorhodospira halochloris TaxID=1052 RepID=A0A2Z6EZP8_HALHR|nr:type VI secretion system baseplate subunit TssE [Halorhodospira halochloris]MBK1651708.1 hypothetical protein [Halorhodospira halochloris]BBE11127.1 hypothetical protein HH1059_18830 [Halorhodospira halochloris]
MPGAGLLDIVQGRVSLQGCSGQQINWHNFKSCESLRLSVAEHIRLLLSARKGCLSHIPGYGVKDLSAFGSDVEYQSARLAADIKKYILDFEPRVISANIKVQPPSQQGSHVLALIVNAKLKGLGEAALDLEMCFAVQGDGTISLWR